jgi:type IV pilus assembly protein PilM
VVVARADDASAMLAAVERVAFAGGSAGANGAWRSERVVAVRRALESVGGRGREVTLVVPDTAARVLLLDFDELPAKAVEALPVVRFRLKKLLSFDADDAAVSYQVMSSSRSGMQVLAVAMPRESLAEYEGLVREAGFEPGAVLPSTLAALAGLDENDRAALVVNAGRDAVTTAIVRGGVLLLHRTIDLRAGGTATAVAATVMAATETTAAEPVSSSGAVSDESARETARDTTIAAIAARFAAMEGQAAGPGSRVGSALASGAAMQSAAPAPVAQIVGASEPVIVAESAAAEPADEVARAVSVAAAYFEDTLETAPQAVLSAGTLGAEALTRLLSAAAGMGSMRVEELVGREILGADASGTAPLGWLAGVRGALRS